MLGTSPCHHNSPGLGRDDIMEKVLTPKSKVVASLSGPSEPLRGMRTLSPPLPHLFSSISVGLRNKRREPDPHHKMLFPVLTRDNSLLASNKAH